MKVFFTASQRGKKYFDEYYKVIYEELQNRGYKHIDSTLINTSIDTFYNSLEDSGLDSYNKLYINNLNHIKNADIVIFECSFNSLSIGYMVEKSLQMNKPTVVLYIKGHTPHFLAGTKEDKLLVKSYTKETLIQTLKAAINEATQLRDKRFNFFISPNLLSYLENAAKKEGITKSALLRNLLLVHQKKSK